MVMAGVENGGNFIVGAWFIYQFTVWELPSQKRLIQ
jgi:hypothetical protein